MKRLLPLAAILFFSAKALPVCAQAINVQDSLALIQLYDSTDGPNWKIKTNWRTTAPAATWFGVLTTGGRVTSLKLVQNFLNGKLPASIGNLTGLTDLEIYANTSLSGTIPTSIGNLTSLTQLYLMGNVFTGTIPASIGNLTQLQIIGLGGNKLGGSIPVTMGNLINLTGLGLSLNALTGPIPTELGNLTALKSISLNNNKLSGVIPSELGNLHVLTDLDLSSNKLTGSIPQTFVGLPLTNLRLSRNLLTDTIPDGIINHQYNYFYVGNNSLTFESFEKLNYKLITHRELSPQAHLHIHKTGTVLSVSAGGTLAFLTFKWYKNGFLDATIKGDSTYNVPSVGSYNVDIYDSLMPQSSNTVYLQTDTVTVSTLPLTLVHFTGSINKNAVELQWQTAIEVNTQYFEVQRSGVSGDFSKAGVVYAVNLPGTNNYNFTDASPLPGINNYRLKIVDKDGVYSFSRVVTVKMGDENTGLQVYPNPARETAIISFNSSLAGEYVINIINLDGKILRRTNVTAVAGLNKVNVDVSAYASGSYVISIISNSGRVQNTRLLKK